MWYDIPVARLLRKEGHPASIFGGVDFTSITYTEVLFKREMWASENPVKGVPNTRKYTRADDISVWWMFPAWRCQSCKCAFIVGYDASDLHHECTAGRDGHPATKEKGK